ncbi:N-acetylmuramoyl-L-alanine amidase [Mycoplasma sp. P36-A1]|uniref:N-acetylmuramoyl-L-alanine amidase n=1 Tax=Mycoplasma sp. P36-A1 TaxID=3252900 RepID=UPI003C2CE407
MDYYLIGGHGAGDPGAVGNGYKEYKLTREFNALLAKYLKKLGKSVHIYDTSRDMYQQSAKGKGLYSWPHGTKPIIIETHFNAGVSSAHGSEVLIGSGLAADKYDKSILKALDKYFTNRGIKKRSDLLNMNIAKQKGLNYRLVEVAFITSKSDMKTYQANKSKLAQYMAEQLTDKKLVNNSKPKGDQPTHSAYFRGNDNKECYINIYSWDKIGKASLTSNYYDTPVEIHTKGRGVVNVATKKKVNIWNNADSKRFLFKIVKI